MKKIIVCVLLTIIFIGCTNQEIDEKEILEFQTKKSDIIESNKPQTKTNDIIESLSIQDYIILDIVAHHDKLIILYSAYDNIEVAPAKIVIADAQNYSVLHEIEDNDIYTSEKIITLDDGFYINKGNNIIVYNYQLEVLKQIDLVELQQEESCYIGSSGFSISADLKKATYVNSMSNALVIYDFDTKEEKEIYHLSDDKGCILSFEELYLKKDFVGFSGTYIYDEDFEIAGSNVHGRINVETGKVDMFEKNGTTTKGIENYILVVDLMKAEDNDLGTGQTVIYDIKNNIETTVDLDLSYNSFDIDILGSDLVVSYNDIGRNKSKLIIYNNGQGEVMDNVIPNNVLYIGTCYVEQNEMMIVYYIIPDGDNLREKIKGVELK